MDGMNCWYKLILKSENQRPNKQIKDNDRMKDLLRKIISNKQESTTR